MGYHLKLPHVKFMQIDGRKWQDTPHSHEDVYQISMPLVGELTALLEKKELNLIEGQSIVANPYSKHGHQLGDKAGSFLIVGLNRKALNEWAKVQHGVKEEIVFHSNQIIFPNDLKKQMKQWLTHLLIPNNHSSLLATETQNNMFSYFFKVLKGSHHVSNTSFSPVILYSDAYLNRVIEYIHTHFTEEVDIETLAKLAQQSKYHFLRNFKRYMNTTPYQYLLNLRIQKGKELLRHTKKSITVIAFELGFSSHIQFYRHFIRQVGCTPIQFRNNL